MKYEFVDGDIDFGVVWLFFWSVVIGIDGVDMDVVGYGVWDVVVDYVYDIVDGWWFV